MKEDRLQEWLRLLKNKNLDGLEDILAEDAVFHSPIARAPQKGKQLVKLYLIAAYHVIVNENFRYVRKVVSDDSAVLEFASKVDGIHINGVDMIRWNEAGKIDDFKVMIRPLKAINLLHQLMLEMISKVKTGQSFSVSGEIGSIISVLVEKVVRFYNIFNFFNDFGADMENQVPCQDLDCFGNS